MNENIPVYGIQNERANEFQTLEKDFKRGISKHPPKQLRIREEDVIQTDRMSVAST